MPARDPITLAWIPGTSLYFEDLDGHELELRGARNACFREPLAVLGQRPLIFS
jgi:hypothetical protein